MRALMILVSIAGLAMGGCRANPGTSTAPATPPAASTPPAPEVPPAPAAAPAADVPGTDAVVDPDVPAPVDAVTVDAVPVDAKVSPTRVLAASPIAVPQGPADVDACLRRKLEAKGLNAYGDAKGTMYAGGTPLFDESSGVRATLADHLRPRFAELVGACEAEPRQ